MNCRSVQELFEDYRGRRLPEADATLVSGHLARCGECAVRSEQWARVRWALRSLPQTAAPPELASELRVLASREWARRQEGIGVPRMLRHWASKLDLLGDNLMRPLAIPLAGGLVSAVILFGLLVPTFNFHRNPIDDVPVSTILYTEATVKSMSPFGCNDDMIVVEVLVDEQGRMLDYRLPNGQFSPDTIRKLENAILTTSFNPATSFGQPMPGRVKIGFRRSQIDIEG